MDDHGVMPSPVLAEDLLACPRCHGPFSREADALVCRGDRCEFRARIVEGIVDCASGAAGPSFFDATFPVMVHGSDEPGPRAAFYAQQAEAVRTRSAGARVIVDVGCGPRLTFPRPAGSTLVGVDLSLESLRQNKDVDVRVYGSATVLPLPSHSVDAVVCFYALHHFVGASVADNERLVRAAFREFGRVLTAGGQLLVFEVAPWSPVWIVQRFGWNAVRRALGASCDMFFWSQRRLAALAAEALPDRSTLELVPFRVAPGTMFPPAFALPRLRIPRLLYPFHICLYHWRMAPPRLTAARTA